MGTRFFVAYSEEVRGPLMSRCNPGGHLGVRDACKKARSFSVHNFIIMMRGCNYIIFKFEKKWV